VWVQPIFTVSVSVKFPDGTTHDLGTKTFDLDGFRTWVKQFLIGASLPVDSAAAEQRLESSWDRLTAATDPYELDEDTIAQSKRVYLYSNNIVAERYVDTTSTMFLNASKPLAGSAQATATLNSDGTLGSGSAQVESKTLATFTALIPTSDLVKSAPQLFGAGQPANYTVQTNIKTNFYKHSHSAPMAASAIPPWGSAGEQERYCDHGCECNGRTRWRPAFTSARS
jgi:hypothetical protein